MKCLESYRTCLLWYIKVCYMLSMLAAIDIGDMTEIVDVNSDFTEQTEDTCPTVCRQSNDNHWMLVLL